MLCVARKQIFNQYHQFYKTSVLYCTFFLYRFFSYIDLFLREKDFNCFNFRCLFVAAIVLTLVMKIEQE